jgi:ribosome maturation factor RimP
MKKKKKKQGKAANRKRPAALHFTPERIGRLVARIRTLVEPMCEAEGFELVHVEFQPEAGGRILRIYIDKPGGVTLDNCAEVSHQISDLLDVSLETVGAYNLEVSSPGVERPLGKMSDFDRFKGKSIRIKTYQPINGQKNFKGILSGLSGEMVQISVNDRTVAIPFTDIQKARLVSHGEDECLYQT